MCLTVGFLCELLLNELSFLAIQKNSIVKKKGPCVRALHYIAMIDRSLQPPQKKTTKLKTRSVSVSNDQQIYVLYAYIKPKS